MAPHSSTLDWKIPWMQEPGRLQSMRLLRVGHDCSDLAVAALLLPPIPPSIRVFSNESTRRMRCPKYWSFSPVPHVPRLPPAQKDLREQKAFSKDSEHSGSWMGEQGQQTLLQSYGASRTTLSKHPLYGGVS